VGAYATLSRTDQCEPLELAGPARQATRESGHSYGGGLMSRTGRLREEVRIYLEENDTANTVEIFDHLNGRFRWGATMNQVGNIMAKDIRFPRSGTYAGSSGGARTPSVFGASPDKLRKPPPSWGSNQG